MLPVRVLREAIVNAVMHRSYRIHGTIQILRYANRLEIRNPGHSLKAEEQLGDRGSQTRNPRIAAVMHEVHLAETKGSGIRAMRELMLAHDLLPPTFESSRRENQFVATFLFHHFLGETDLLWLRQLTTEKLSDEEARALVFVREVGAIDNAAYRTINHTDTLQASAHLRRLRDLEILAMKGAGSRTYYVPGPAFALASEGPTPSPVTTQKVDVTEGDPHKVSADRHMADAEPHMVTADHRKLGTDPHKGEASPPVVLSAGDLPAPLRARLTAAGDRPRRPGVRALIRDLCGWRPLSAREPAALLRDRDARVLVREHLAPMVEAGELAYTIPGMPRHPEQRYTTSTGEEP